nr:MAG TPA: hypothetical protein [Caudoviricetes sp.]
MALDRSGRDAARLTYEREGTRGRQDRRGRRRGRRRRARLPRRR